MEKYHLVWDFESDLLPSCQESEVESLVRLSRLHFKMSQFLTQEGKHLALLNIFDHFGRGLGPEFVAGQIISLCGRQADFNWVIRGWILCGLFNICIFFTVQSDEARTRSVFL